MYNTLQEGGKGMVMIQDYRLEEKGGFLFRR
jgi:hypothetical protein